MKTDAPSIESLGDIEDIWKIVPPCVAWLRTRAFPKHRARMDLTPILKEAGLTVEDAERFYEAMNSAYPRETGVPLRGRYALKYDWERTRSSVFCGALIQNALVRGTTAPGEHLVCPFAAAAATAIENTHENRKLINAQCYRACSEATSLRGLPLRKPADVIRQLAQNQRFISQIHRDDASDSDDDDEPMEDLES